MQALRRLLYNEVHDSVRVIDSPFGAAALQYAMLMHKESRGAHKLLGAFRRANARQSINPRTSALTSMHRRPMHVEPEGPSRRVRARTTCVEELRNL